jgi:chromate transporter
LTLHRSKSDLDGFHRIVETFAVFLKLGLTSFGGPIAHLGYFREECVQRRKWLTDAAYADLVALCQFLPGPASSQVGFALGYIRAGVWGAFVAWAAFTLPSALIMIVCAYGLPFIQTDSAWLHGLKIAAVAVVAQAVWSMAVKLCPDRTRVTMAVIAACLVLGFNTAWAQVVVIGAGMAAGWLCFHRRSYENSGQNSEELNHVHRGAFAVANLGIFFGLLIGLPLLAASFKSEWIALADSFYRAGSLVFGGGHVVLPLLEAETAGRGLLTRNEFLAGYGAAQALPGPLFTFAAYLGAVIMPGGPGWLAGLWCLIAVLLPSFLLVLGALPYWHQLRQSTSAQAALTGANAAVVGILLAAFYHPVWTAAIDSSRAMILALTAFCALQFWRVPPWLLVILCAAGGAALLPISR